MKCISMLKGGKHGCGQCLPCCIKKRSIWTFRLMLEARVHKHVSFLTLTYDDDHYPAGGSLDYSHIQAWLKRFRKALRKPLRFFCVAEYGDHTQRPHYHLILFGASPDDIHLVRATWHYGTMIQMDPLTVERAQYAAGYTTKKMTKKDDIRLYGRKPEFAKMSLKPGIGAPAVPQLAAPLLTNQFAKEFLASEGDVPGFFKAAGRTFPTGRYLKGKLQNELLFDQSVTGKYAREKFKREKEREELLALWEASGTLTPYFSEKGFVDDPQKADQRLRNLKARIKLKQARTL